MKSYEQYIRDGAVPRKVIDDFLDGKANRWVRYDSELGYVLGNSMQRNGINNCRTVSTVQSNGARTSFMYADKPCRINTYGDSFTECSQVSDGETWEEYLAGHLGEPIRNFGVGGFGLYQAYRRMIRTEKSELGAKYVLLYIYDDDHRRSIMRCRHAVTYPYWKLSEGKPFHGNFWCNIEIDLHTRQFVEKENLLPTSESLYRMTDPDFLYEALKEDVMVQIYSLSSGQVNPDSIDFTQINAIADILGVAGVELQDRDGIIEAVKRISLAYGFAATRIVIEKALEFCRSRRRELMILLLSPRATKQLLHGESRYDREILDYLDEKKINYFDMNRIHLADYGKFNLSIEDYMARYYIGHYSPAGNHFFAYSLKDAMVRWLNPKPITYRETFQENRKGDH